MCVCAGHRRRFSLPLGLCRSSSGKHSGKRRSSMFMYAVITCLGRTPGLLRHLCLLDPVGRHVRHVLPKPRTPMPCKTRFSPAQSPVNSSSSRTRSWNSSGEDRRACWKPCPSRTQQECQARHSPSDCAAQRPNLGRLHQLVTNFTYKKVRGGEQSASHRSRDVLQGFGSTPVFRHHLPHAAGFFDRQNEELRGFTRLHARQASARTPAHIQVTPMRWLAHGRHSLACEATSSPATLTPPSRSAGKSKDFNRLKPKTGPRKLRTYPEFKLGRCGLVVQTVVFVRLALLCGSLMDAVEVRRSSNCRCRPSTLAVGGVAVIDMCTGPRQEYRISRKGHASDS